MFSIVLPVFISFCANLLIIGCCCGFFLLCCYTLPLACLKSSAALKKWRPWSQMLLAASAQQTEIEQCGGSEVELQWLMNLIVDQTWREMFLWTSKCVALATSFQGFTPSDQHVDGRMVHLLLIGSQLEAKKWLEWWWWWCSTICPAFFAKQTIEI